jgi:hypothetical protein
VTPFLAGERDIPLGPIVAAIGAVLLIVSLFLDWYDGVSGFTVFEFVDILLVLLALVTVFSLVGVLGLVRADVSPALSLGVALITVFVVVVQILNDPPAVVGSGSGKDIGIWLALSGGALMVAGALLSSTHISLAVEPRERRPRDAGAHPDATTRSAPTARAGEAEGRVGPARPLSDPEGRAPGRPSGPPGPERP